MTATQNILKISELLDAWRSLGCTRLRNGTELIGRIPMDEEESWLHIVFPRLSSEAVRRLERSLGEELPPDLRTLYRCMGGLSVFGGMFEVAGHLANAKRHTAAAWQPRCLITLNHEIDALQWKTRGVVAFATNQWDMSVYTLGMGGNPGEVARRDRRTGQVIETHPDVFDCLASRLYKLDQMSMQ